MKAINLIIGHKYIWRRNSSTQHEATFIGVDESGKYTQYVFEYDKEGNKYYAYLSVHHVESDISELKKADIKIWGVNKRGEKIKEHDKLLCGSGLDKWYTHVLFNEEANAWHREQDYYCGELVGSYEI